MFDRLHLILGRKSILSLLFAFAVICGVFLNGMHRDSFIGYHPENIKSCTTDVLSLPCSPSGRSLILLAAAFITYKLFSHRRKEQHALTPYIHSLGVYDINYLQLFDPLQRCLRRGIICRLVYH